MPKGNKKNPAVRRIIILCAVIAAAALLLAAGLNADRIFSALSKNATLTVKPAKGEAMIAALDTDQSNCAVILAGGSVVMIDSGDPDAAPAILSFMWAYGIDRIDYLVMTHPHTDHIGSMSEVIRTARVGELLFVPVTEELTPTNYTYYELIETISARGVNMRAVSEGEIFPLEIGRLRVVAANRGMSSLNDCSMVLCFEYGSVRALFMGDAEKAVEYAILDSGADISSDILFVGHHGSYTSSHRSFVAAVSPDYALISCGADNSYGYPHDVVLENLEAVGASILRTDINGNVIFLTSGSEVQMIKER